jgi:hypothetical protein
MEREREGEREKDRERDKGGVGGVHVYFVRMC